MLKSRKIGAFRFRRFANKAYAAFRSLHIVVNIGSVAGYIADLQMKKSKNGRLLPSIAECLTDNKNENHDSVNSDSDTDFILCPIVALWASVNNQKSVAAQGYEIIQSNIILPDRLPNLSGFFI